MSIQHLQKTAYAAGQREALSAYGLDKYAALNASSLRAAGLTLIPVAVGAGTAAGLAAVLPSVYGKGRSPEEAVLNAGGKTLLGGLIGTGLGSLPGLAVKRPGLAFDGALAGGLLGGNIGHVASMVPKPYSERITDLFD